MKNSPPSSIYYPNFDFARQSTESGIKYSENKGRFDEYSIKRMNMKAPSPDAYNIVEKNGIASIERFKHLK